MGIIYHLLIKEQLLIHAPHPHPPATLPVRSGFRGRDVIRTLAEAKGSLFVLGHGQGEPSSQPGGPQPGVGGSDL